MELRRSLVSFVTIVAISNAALGSKLGLANYGVRGYNDNVYNYNEGNVHEREVRQSLPTKTSPSLLHSLVSGLKRVLSRDPVDRQGPALAGLVSGLQAAAVPLAVVGIAAANRNQILNAIDPPTTTTAGTTTSADYCSGITCSGIADTCDTNSGLCKCGSAGGCGPPFSNICTSGACTCSTVTKCSAGTTPNCIKTSTGQEACTVDLTTTDACKCQCLTDAECQSAGGANVCCVAGTAGMVVGKVGTCVASPAADNCD